MALVSLSGEIFVHKDHEPAWTVTTSPAYQKFMTEHLSDDIICVLAHTRKATKGNPYHNKNNHPLIKDAGVVIHNGMLSNDDKLFADLKLERGAETDSDILRAILDARGAIDKDTISELNRVAGSVASALVHPSDPTKLLLLRSGNPLVVADDGQILYFASDKRAIYRAARPWIERHGMPMQLQSPNIAFVTMPNDTGWIIGSGGLEWHDKFTASATRYRWNTYSEVYSPNGREARRSFQREQAERQAKVIETPAPERVVVSNTDIGMVNYVRCPNRACADLLALREEQSRLPLSQLRCPKCKTNLHGAVKSCRLLSKQTDQIQPSVN